MDNSLDDEIRAAAMTRTVFHLSSRARGAAGCGAHPPGPSSAGEPIVTNGLGLCKIHHSAYDAHIIGIDPEARVHVREDILREKDGPMLKHGLQEVAGSGLILPGNEDLRPNREFLAERFERFRAA